MASQNDDDDFDEVCFFLSPFLFISSFVFQESQPSQNIRAEEIIEKNAKLKLKKDKTKQKVMVVYGDNKLQNDIRFFSLPHPKRGTHPDIHIA